MVMLYQNRLSLLLLLCQSDWRWTLCCLVNRCRWLSTVWRVVQGMKVLCPLIYQHSCGERWADRNAWGFPRAGKSLYHRARNNLAKRVPDFRTFSRHSAQILLSQWLLLLGAKSRKVNPLPPDFRPDQSRKTLDDQMRLSICHII